MKRFLCILLLSLSLTYIIVPASVFAGTPLQSFMEIRDERHIITKTFEAAPDEDPARLIEDPFIQDGFSYSYYDTAIEEILVIDSRIETKEETISTENDDAQSILQQLAPNMEYEGNDGFTGTLTLDHGSIQTVVEGYTAKTYTITDTITIMGLSNNDSSNVPKTTVKSGVTLKLQNIDWVTQTAEAIDYTSIPTSYKAVAHYSGTYSKSIPTGYISTVIYQGEVTKTGVEKIIYTLSYIGEEVEIPESKPETSLKWWIVGVAICLAIIAGVLLAFFMLYYNTAIYLKNADEYSLIAKRRIKWNNPVVDLNPLDIRGKEVAVNVKKRIAKKLFGRYINTVADGNFSTRCLVDKQNVDFWYIVNVPELPNEPNTTDTPALSE